MSDYKLNHQVGGLVPQAFFSGASLGAFRAYIQLVAESMGLARGEAFAYQSRDLEGEALDAACREAGRKAASYLLTLTTVLVGPEAQASGEDTAEAFEALQRAYDLGWSRGRRNGSEDL